MSFAITNEDTNLRTGPGTNYEIRCTVGKNRRVEITDHDGKWARVKVMQGDYKDKIGWMWYDNLEKDG